MAPQDRGHPLHEAVLEPVGIVHPLAGHQRLAVRAAFPLRHVHLVAAHVHVFRREKVADLAEDILQQGVVLLAGHAPGRSVVVSGRERGVGREAAADLGMERGDGPAVAREVDLGDHLDVAHRGVADDLPHLVLRVVAAVFFVEFAVYGPDGRIAAAESAHLGQLRVRLDLDAPPLVVHQVDVQLVDVVPGQQVDLALQRLGGDPRAGDVEHHAAVGKLRSVFPHTARQRHGLLQPFAGIDLGRQQAEERLQAVEHAAVVGAAHGDVVGCDLQPVAFGRGLRGRIDQKRQDAVGGRLPLNGAFEVFGGIFRQREQPFVCHEGHGGSERELPSGRCQGGVGRLGMGPGCKAEGKDRKAQFGHGS